jgi:phosphopantothenoylcysteine decarboxylase/phosphopantothenate--cysteine ligase
MSSPDALFYLRDSDAVVIGHQDEITVFRNGGRPICMKSHANQDLYRVLESLRETRTLAQVVSHTGLSADRVRTILDVFVEKGVALCGSFENVNAAIPVRLAPNRKLLCDNLVLGISGTVQAALVINLAMVLRSHAAKEVEVVLTASAMQFIRPRVISYFGMRAWTDLFETRDETNVPHIGLATNADVVLIAPASAHTIHRLATGACSDLLSLTVAATAAPVIVVPAMNSRMLACPAVQRNIDRLRSDGLYVVEPSLAFEVSSTSDGSLGFCGTGVNERNVLAVLQTVLHHRASSRDESERAVASVPVKVESGAPAQELPIQPETCDKRSVGTPACDKVA